MGAELVEEEVDFHASLGAFDEGIFEAISNGVAFDNVEVNEEVVLSACDGFEDTFKDLFAIDEKVGIVATGEWYAG